MVMLSMVGCHSLLLLTWNYRGASQMILCTSVDSPKVATTVDLQLHIAS